MAATDAAQAEAHEPKTELKRVLSPKLLLLFIVGDILGAGIYAVTGDPWMLGLVGLAEVLPYFCVAPFAGYLVDHLPRRKLGMVAATGLALTPLLLALVVLVVSPLLLAASTPVLRPLSAAQQAERTQNSELTGLATDIVAVDMRLPDRLIVQLSEEAGKARDELFKDKKSKKKAGDSA